MAKRETVLTEIRVPRALDDSTFETLATRWDNAVDGMWVNTPSGMKSRDAAKMTLYLLRKIPRDLAFSVLADLAEMYSLRPNLLEKIFDHGDERCKSSVCLRNDLPAHLEEKCRNSPYGSVRDHYQARVKYYGQMG
jgi:hypothetical protein